jgi:hypothetical protein
MLFLRQVVVQEQVSHIHVYKTVKIVPLCAGDGMYIKSTFLERTTILDFELNVSRIPQV